jgi:WD40 repeat protein
VHTWLTILIPILVTLLCSSISAKENRDIPRRSIDRPSHTWDYDGKRIIGHVGVKICLWDAETGKLIRKMTGHGEALVTLRFSPDGIHALSSSWRGSGPMIADESKDTRTIVWNLANGDQVANFQDQVAWEFNPDGTQLVAFSRRRENTERFDVAVWDVFNKRELIKVELAEHRGSPTWDSLHFVGDGKRFVYFAKAL